MARAQADTLPVVTTARDLVAYHAARARFYRAAAILLADSPAPRRLATARALLAGGPARNGFGRGERELLALVAEARPDEVSADALSPRGPVSIGCGRASCPSRLRACVAADVAPGADRVSEVLMLGVLAERTARALAEADMVTAATSSDLQADLLGDHAGACLLPFTRELEASRLPFYARLGRAIGRQVEEDLIMFGPPLAATSEG